MTQVYVHFDKSIFEGKKDPQTGNVTGQEKTDRIIHVVDAHFPVAERDLPPLASHYLDMVHRKGFVGEGSPILYLTAQKHTVVDDGRRDTTFNLVADWPSLHGNLGRVQSNKGFVALRYSYFTDLVGYEEFQKSLESAKVKDCGMEQSHNQYDLLELIKVARWNVLLDVVAQRASHDSQLPVSILNELNTHHEDYKGRIREPGRRTPLDEVVSLRYKFNSELILSEAGAETYLSPRLSGGAVTEFEVDDTSEVPQRSPKSWSISKEGDVIAAVNGLKGYAEVVEKCFVGKNLLSQEGLHGKKLEIMLKDVLPALLDTFIDFVEN